MLRAERQTVVDTAKERCTQLVPGVATIFTASVLGVITQMCIADGPSLYIIPCGVLWTAVCLPFQYGNRTNKLVNKAIEFHAVRKFDNLGATEPTEPTKPTGATKSTKPTEPTKGTDAGSKKQ